MAALKGNKVNSPAFMKPDGNARFLADKYSFTANPTAADTLDLVRIPAGSEVCMVDIVADDLDTNGTPTFAFSVGYTPCDSGSSLSPSATYFAGTGQTTARTGGRLSCVFDPIVFEEDVWLRLTIGTASATFAAGDIHGIVGANCNGVK